MGDKAVGAGVTEDLAVRPASEGKGARRKAEKLLEKALKAQRKVEKKAEKKAQKKALKHLLKTGDVGRRIQVRRSGVHGKGVFALQPIPEGETIIEYIGEIITWKQAQKRPPHNPKEPNHTFYFHIDEKHVIDAAFGGNAARWINHSCKPNCEAEEDDGRVFIKAVRNIEPGEELSYDYGLIIEERYTAKLKAEYPCWCGAKNCRGTLLAPKRGSRK